MNAGEVKALLESSIRNCEVVAEGEGCNFQVVVVTSEFEGLSTVKRQQLVYSHLQEAISSGAIHAVTMKTYTPEQISKL
ncbi:cell division protein BolA [Marinomonas sp. UCMA 3892]|uniref:Acid stress-induced BolA-like protein IbaG/YrbA, predicted regulator of iron metabolism n=2 Tax=Marinomonas TaxID=28253 RepID=A0A1M5D371_9GAMM|nr:MULTISPECIES: BolA/IbaG family iron-sulfur metabolism protein [Marinomonas]MBU1296564.1 BolA/IbaG family iron-sulfur metabolism protein [Gammaproteobacteria bacterium]NLU99048.1 cell division protein BolA [Marinomonas sp. UCMA 3892]MBU1466013.1 BolA/IbaG family iron-sulfur metabolism protein [Gammaproteobacteria bacterium]MBU2021440.1 BolA/IbaG family iron-sulfur metabolism protein [Gammaproteobacteria bacterium]MBU2239601.1 BolA/IbaG family iron-sulfur metabolism protein [Gammaproteobacter